MGGRAEQLVEHAIRALLTTDVALAHQAVASDKVIDKLERQIRGVHSTHKKKGQERASDRLLPEEPEE